MSKAVVGPIGRQGASYRHGLVLGLTMAEVMLLLVFCLLIAVGALLSRENQKRHELEQREAALELSAQSNSDLVMSLKAFPQLQEALRNAAATADPKVVDEFWRELILSASTMDQLKSQGLTADDARKDAAFLAEAERLKSEGLDLSKAQRMSTLVAGIAAIIGSASDEQILAAVRAGANPTPIQPGNRWPPIITLSDKHYFNSGKAELTPEFEFALRDKVIPDLLQNGAKYGVDVVEVVGHTDEQPVAERASNLDTELPKALAGQSAIDALRPADNAGLGLARAVAVVQLLRSDERIKKSGFKILPLSGGQLIETDETLAQGKTVGDVPERRRIEIRMRQSSTAIAASNGRGPP